MNEAFVLTNWVKMCLGSFESEHLPTQMLLDRAGVDAALLDQALFPVVAANALFRAALDVSGNPLLGINAGRNISPTTFSALGYSAIACENLWQSFSLIANFSASLTDITNLYLVDDGDRVGFGFDPSPAGVELHFIGYDAALCMVARICRQLQEGPAVIREVLMARPRPAVWQPYERYFKAPVRWNQQQFCIFFDKAYFQRRNRHADCGLAQESSRIADQYFGSLLGATRYTHTVRRLINQSLSNAALSMADIASALNLSERTLQRLLSAEGTSFSKLLEEVRKEAARRYVEVTHFSVSKIAFALGFNDSGNFSRAFKRWFGYAPHIYRQRLKEKQPPTLPGIDG